MLLPFLWIFRIAHFVSIPALMLEKSLSLLPPFELFLLFPEKAPLHSRFRLFTASVPLQDRSNLFQRSVEIHAASMGTDGSAGVGLWPEAPNGARVDVDSCRVDYVESFFCLAESGNDPGFGCFPEGAWRGVIRIRRVQVFVM